MIDMEKFSAAVDAAKKKFDTDMQASDTSGQADQLQARMDWMIARDNLCIVEVTLDRSNVTHLANLFRESAVGHVRLMREYGPSPATPAVLDFYAPLLDVIYNTNVEVINAMPQVVEDTAIPSTIL